MGRRTVKLVFSDGATPVDDISGLKIDWVKTQSDLNKAEAENIIRAVTKFLFKPVSEVSHWFNLTTMQKIHFEMFCDVWDWAGKFRRDRTVPGVDPHLIAPSLQALLADVQYWCQNEVEMQVIEQAARVHHRLAYIHPFLNGNGRFARLISDRYLKANHIAFPKWPYDMGENGEVRKKYIGALRDADQGEFKTLILFMQKYGAG